ncbi:MAG: catalase [Clostridia bacterium]|nr:catalase [Clostridia bacterium]
MGHILTVIRHRRAVRKNCFRAGIPWRGLVHDLSKYSPTELFPGIRYYQGNRSPNERERELFGYSKAWLHHKGRNRHHFEYWNDVNMTTHRYEPVKMPTVFAVEMFCDRVGASKVYRGKDYTDSDPLNYFLRGNARAKMHPETADDLERRLRLLAEKGEKEAFAEIRAEVKAARREEKEKRKTEKKKPKGSPEK